MTHLTTDEAAARLRETPATIARNCAAGLIPAARIGGRWLIAESVIDAMLKPTNVDHITRTRSTATRRRAS